MAWGLNSISRHEEKSWYRKCGGRILEPPVQVPSGMFVKLDKGRVGGEMRVAEAAHFSSLPKVQAQPLLVQARVRREQHLGDEVPSAHSPRPRQHSLHSLRSFDHVARVGPVVPSSAPLQHVGHALERRPGQPGPGQVLVRQAVRAQRGLDEGLVDEER